MDFWIVCQGGFYCEFKIFEATLCKKDIKFCCNVVKLMHSYCFSSEGRIKISW